MCIPTRSSDVAQELQLSGDSPSLAETATGAIGSHCCQNKWAREGAGLSRGSVSEWTQSSDLAQVPPKQAACSGALGKREGPEVPAWDP